MRGRPASIVRMKLRITAFGLSAALCFGTACSSSDNANNGGDGGGSVHPAASIDITSCASVVNANDTSSMDACSSCCTTNGFDVSGFINLGHCTCAHASEPDSVTCANNTASSSDCSNCCSAASYYGSSWWQVDTSASCSCSNKHDESICASTLTADDAADQCAICCLNHGFISDAYIGVGVPQCSCIAP
jgi:hypothetical protein